MLFICFFLYNNCFLLIEDFRFSNLYYLGLKYFLLFFLFFSLSLLNDILIWYRCFYDLLFYPFTLRSKGLVILILDYWFYLLLFVITRVNSLDLLLMCLFGCRYLHLLRFCLYFYFCRFILGSLMFKLLRVYNLKLLLLFRWYFFSWNIWFFFIEVDTEAKFLLLLFDCLLSFVCFGFLVHV